MKIQTERHTDIDSINITFNTAVTETAGEILGKHRQKKNKVDHRRNSSPMREKERTEKRKYFNLKDLRNK